jgi:hypothetical protein
MKTKKEIKKKFELEKFEVAKLTKSRKIVGGGDIVNGTGGDLTTTGNHGKVSTYICTE